jgi:membrane protein DedA with SNARE-associated domain
MGPFDALSGAALYAGLFVAALVEYVFPPFPGDSVSVLGGALVTRAQGSLLLAVLALTAGSLVGITACWRVGVGLGSGLDARPDEARVLGLSMGALKRAAAKVRVHGTWLLLANRFLPSFRAVLFVAAGAAGLRLPRVLLLGGCSALAWNSLLVGVGVALGANVERIEAWLSTYRAVALGVAAVLVLGFGARWAWRRRVRPR